MAHVEGLGNPALLRWARESASLTPDAIAKKVGVKVDRILAWENGQERPSVAQLRNFATATKRPLAVFYLAAPPAPSMHCTTFVQVLQENRGHHRR